jgi:hypothetical protein
MDGMKMLSASGPMALIATSMAKDGGGADVAEEGFMEVIAPYTHRLALAVAKHPDLWHEQKP